MVFSKELRKLSFKCANGIDEKLASSSCEYNNTYSNMETLHKWFQKYIGDISIKPDTIFALDCEYNTFTIKIGSLGTLIRIETFGSASMCGNMYGKKHLKIIANEKTIFSSSKIMFLDSASNVVEQQIVRVLIEQMLKPLKRI